MKKLIGVLLSLLLVCGLSTTKVKAADYKQQWELLGYSSYEEYAQQPYWARCGFQSEQEMLDSEKNWQLVAKDVTITQSQARQITCQRDIATLLNVSVIGWAEKGSPLETISDFGSNYTGGDRYGCGPVFTTDPRYQNSFVSDGTDQANEWVAAVSSGNVGEYQFTYCMIGETIDGINVTATITVVPDGSADPVVKRTVTVNYVYEDGSKAAPQYVRDYGEGMTYSIPSPTIAGYTANKTKVAGTLEGADVNVTVTYTKNKEPNPAPSNGGNGSTNSTATTKTVAVKTDDDTRIMTNGIVMLGSLLVALATVLKKRALR